MQKQNQLVHETMYLNIIICFDVIFFFISGGPQQRPDYNNGHNPDPDRPAVQRGLPQVLVYLQAQDWGRPRDGRRHLPMPGKHIWFIN